MIPSPENRKIQADLMAQNFDPSLERQIAHRFTDIADIGWFNPDLPEDSAQLNSVHKFLRPQPGQKILDAGCARGRFIPSLAQTGADLYGVDLTWKLIRSASAAIPAARFANGSLSALPFADSAFDAVYCVEALEHLPDTALALSEMARVLKPAGTLLIIDKSLQALDPANGLPTLLVKPWAERKGRWMYPPDFPFRERWFWPHALARQLRAYCSSVAFHFIPEGRGKASHLYRLLPFLSLDVAWVARK